MATKQIVLDRIERKHLMPNLSEMQELDKSVKKILLITLKGDKMLVDVEVEEKKTRAKPALKEIADKPMKKAAPAKSKSKSSRTTSTRKTTLGKKTDSKK
tara:strand:- start:116 stop:415 length:300 start_codon:yes stop_codon:yes gene_type:complete